MADEDNEVAGEPLSLQPTMELIGMAVGNGRAVTGELIKVLSLTVELQIPMNAESSRSLGEAFLASGISVERQMPKGPHG